MGLLVEAGGSLCEGPVVVPFGAAWHDWAALELGAWVARATGAPLRLIGAPAEGRGDRRDASHVLADASLIVQRRAGVIAEPLLGRPSRRGVTALAQHAGLLVVGLSERWHEEGLGRIGEALVAGPAGSDGAGAEERRATGTRAVGRATRFGWSVTADAS